MIFNAGNTEGMSQSTSGGYLEFQADGSQYKYHGNGRLFNVDDQVKDNWLTVWDDNFCCEF